MDIGNRSGELPIGQVVGDDPRTQAIFDEILRDEVFHMNYTYTQLARLLPNGYRKQVWRAPDRTGRRRRSSDAGDLRRDPARRGLPHELHIHPARASVAEWISETGLASSRSDRSSATILGRRRSSTRSCATRSST